MKQQTIIITGASDGIGAIVARKLRNMQANVVVVGRSPDKTRQIADELHADSYIADFSKLDEVRRLAAQLKQAYPRIDVLINNAGGIFGNRELTVDGHEKTMQVNHLAPFLLTNLLIDTLAKSKARVINVSSVAHLRFGNLNIDDVELEHDFSPNRAYGNSKLANILFTTELHRRYGKQGISTVAVHPGNLSTNFASDTTSLLRFVYRTGLGKLLLQTPEKGGEVLVWFASSESGKDWTPGAYYDQFKPGKQSAQARDAQLAKQLWDVSEKLTAR